MPRAARLALFATKKAFVRQITRVNRCRSGVASMPPTNDDHLAEIKATFLANGASEGEYSTGRQFIF